MYILFGAKSDFQRREESEDGTARDPTDKAKDKTLPF